MTEKISRRSMLKTTGLTTTGAVIGSTLLNQSKELKGAEGRVNQIKYCLNTGTIRGQKLGIVEEIKVTAKAGYQSIEPWMRDIHQYQSEGGSLNDLKKLIEDSGLTVDLRLEG